MSQYISFCDVIIKYPQINSLHALDRYKLFWPDDKIRRFFKLERILNKSNSREAIEYKVLISLFNEFDILSLPKRLPAGIVKKSNPPISNIYTNIIK